MRSANVLSTEWRAILAAPAVDVVAARWRGELGRHRIVAAPTRLAQASRSRPEPQRVLAAQERVRASTRDLDERHGREDPEQCEPAQAAAIRAWLDECTIAWTVCSSTDAPVALEGRLLVEYRPSLNRKSRWQPRSTQPADDQR